MISRWFHKPYLHVASTDGAERRVGWLELFYDLIYVAAFIQLGNALSDHVGLTGALAFGGLFIPIWTTWTSFTFFSNRFVVDDFVHRMVVFVQMMGIGAMAVFVGQVLVGEPRGFALSYIVVRSMLVVMYARAWLQLEVPEARALARRYAVGFALGMAFWMASLFLPTPWVFVAWAAGIGVDVSAILSRQTRSLIGRYQPDVEHMTERYGLLTIIVLGESFVKVLSSLAQQGEATVLPMAALALTITCCVWWIYFDDVAGSEIRPTRAATWIWIYTHLPLTGAIVASGVAIKKAAFFDPSFAGAANYRWLLCGSLALAFAAVGVIDHVTRRRNSELRDAARVQVRLVSAAVLVLLAPSGAWLPGSVFVAMVATICVGQVLIDLSMAPRAERHALLHEGHGHAASAAAVRMPLQRRPDLSEAVRKGTPNELRRDLYFHLMHGSWTRVVVTLLAAYLVINIVFASLYLLEPGSIEGVRAGSFLDAFSFSVQTMSTIGYGAMTPGSNYGHTLVAIEAAVGLLGVALATGLMFAKAARPTSSVLFSEPVLIGVVDGRRTLYFRAGNARGNEVVEASVRVSVLRDTVTPEGHTLRRLDDLALRRRHSPVFTLSWTVFHTIDEDSPLHGVDAGNIAERVYSIIVTMTGYDATYGQQTHARHIYYPEDVRFGERFVDVISDLADGRILIDYTAFHETEPHDTSTTEHAESDADDDRDEPATTA